MFGKKLTLHFLSRKLVLIFGFIVDVVNSSSVQVWCVCFNGFALGFELQSCEYLKFVLLCRFAQIWDEREMRNF